MSELIKDIVKEQIAIKNKIFNNEITDTNMIEHIMMRDVLLRTLVRRNIGYMLLKDNIDLNDVCVLTSDYKTIKTKNHTYTLDKHMSVLFEVHCQFHEIEANQRVFKFPQFNQNFELPPMREFKTIVLETFPNKTDYLKWYENTSIEISNEN